MRANQSGRKASNSGNGSVATRSISRSGSQNALMPSTAPMASCSASGQASTGVAAYQVLGSAVVHADSQYFVDQLVLTEIDLPPASAGKRVS